MKIEGVDYEEVGLYLALTNKPEKLTELGLAESCPVQKSNTGRPPMITASGTEVGVRWYGHVLRRDDGHVLRKASAFEVKGKRKQG